MTETVTPSPSLVAAAKAKTDDLALTRYDDYDQLKKDQHIDQAALSDALAEHTGLYVHYAVQSVRARTQHERLKGALEVTEAMLNNRHRQMLEGEAEAAGITDAKGVTKIKNVTETMVRAAVVTDPLYRSMTKRVLEAQEIRQKCEAFASGMDGRKDLLLQLARDASKALDGPLRVAGNVSAIDAKSRLLEKMNAGAA